jgi:CheY-like chemotaxis protein
MVADHDKDGLGEDAIAAGFSAFLTKPVKQSQLFNTIAELCARSERIVAPSFTSAEAPAAEARAGRVLLAEDNRINQRIALLQLKTLGVTAVDVVPDGAKAVAGAMSGLYDLILMDCQMPGMNGFEATTRIRRAEAMTGAHVPIVAMTANALEGDRESCIGAGMDEYLAKPVELSALRAILDRFLDQAAAEIPERTAV